MIDKETSECPKEETVEANFDGEFIFISGSKEALKNIAQHFTFSDRRNGSSVKYLIMAIEKDSDFNGDFWTSEGLIRILFIPSRENPRISIGGGGNSTDPEVMAKIIREATGLSL